MVRDGRRSRPARSRRESGGLAEEAPAVGTGTARAGSVAASSLACCMASLHVGRAHCAWTGQGGTCGATWTKLSSTRTAKPEASQQRFVLGDWPRRRSPTFCTRR
eukprot:7384260-Prymnesium_polylepis.1